MREWRGPIALVLATGVAVALVSGVLAAELTPTKITSEEIAFLSTLGGAAVGAIAAYLGNHALDRSDMTTSDPTPTPEPEPEPTAPTPEEVEASQEAAAQTPTLDHGEVEDSGPDEAP